MMELMKNIIDVLIVWLVLYFVLKSLSKNLKFLWKSYFLYDKILL